MILPDTFIVIFQLQSQQTLFGLQKQLKEYFWLASKSHITISISVLRGRKNIYRFSIEIQWKLTKRERNKIAATDLD